MLSLLPCYTSNILSLIIHRTCCRSFYASKRNVASHTPNILSLIIHRTCCRSFYASKRTVASHTPNILSLLQYIWLTYSYACDLYVGVIPRNNVTDVTVREMLVGRAPSLSVVTVPMNTAKSPYSRIENSKSAFCIIMCVVITCPAAHCCRFILLYVCVSVA